MATASLGPAPSQTREPAPRIRGLANRLNESTARVIDATRRLTHISDHLYAPRPQPASNLDYSIGQVAATVENEINALDTAINELMKAVSELESE